jgi:hypothetical protein
LTRRFRQSFSSTRCHGINPRSTLAHGWIATRARTQSLTNRAFFGEF